MKSSQGVAMAFVLASTTCWGFGRTGHRTVGAIADRLLANKPEAATIDSLLGGLTLAEASLIADDIKHWDGPVNAAYPWTSIPAVLYDMWDFPVANSDPPASHGHNVDHHGFHFTDISIDSPLAYDPHNTGATPTDVMHMVNYCIEVLQGAVHQPNPHRIKATVAVILLTHYVWAPPISTSRETASTPTRLPIRLATLAAMESVCSFKPDSLTRRSACVLGQPRCFRGCQAAAGIHVAGRDKRLHRR